MDNIKYLFSPSFGFTFSRVDKDSPLAAYLGSKGVSESPRISGELRAVSGYNTYVKAEDTNTLLALAPGCPVIDNGVVNIVPESKIDSGKDINSGKITFDGNLYIGASIGPGTTVDVTGSLIIDGKVESASVKSGGNVLIKGGISGSNRRKSSVCAHGDVSISFMQYGKIRCGGNLKINDSVLNSHIECGGAVSVLGSEGILGGETYAASSLQSVRLGNEKDIFTVVYIGMNPYVSLLIAELEEARKDLLKKKESTKKLIISSVRRYADAGENLDLEDVLLVGYQKNELKKINFKLGRVNRKLEDLNERRNGKKEPFVKVQGTIYPGVKISSLSESEVIKEAVSGKILFSVSGARLRKYEQ
ncbi:MAG: FapA family protein [Fibrobacterota bacterium]